MSTRVDSDSLYSASAVETVKKMSTKVDQRVWFFLVETVIKMSTEVDLALGSDIERLFETVSGMSTKVDWRYQES